MSSPIRPTPGILTPLERLGAGIPLQDAGPSFADLFRRALGDTAALEDDAKNAIAAFLRGEPVELHQVMAASEEAAISLELLVEVRNKLTEAYRTIMNLQV